MTRSSYEIGLTPASAPYHDTVSEGWWYTRQSFAAGANFNHWNVSSTAEAAAPPADFRHMMYERIYARTGQLDYSQGEPTPQEVVAALATLTGREEYGLSMHHLRLEDPDKDAGTRYVTKNPLNIPTQAQGER